MQQWLTGYKLKNRPYEILEELGQGGFGITYKAKSLALDVPVVIKTPNNRLQRDKNYSKYLANFTKEAKQLAKLGMNPHPNIVRVFDFFEENGLPCIVMDYIPGNSLYDRVQMNGALPEKQALRYIKQIGSALSVCHQQGIIHRDAHPNNILIHADSGKAILIDFGISGSTQTSRSNRSGNQAFAPWEQLISWGEESSKTPQVDIYTLAASFYYLVTEDTPTPSLARKFNNDELKEPKQHNPQLSDRINQAILKGMAIEVKDRPESIKKWLDFLKLGNIKDQQNQEKKIVFLDLMQFETVKINETKNLFKSFRIREKKSKYVLNKEQRQAKYFTENLGNGITLDMVKIPSGTFLMGSPDSEEERDEDESPQHQVTVPSFYMAKYQITQAQWKQVVSLLKIDRYLSPNSSQFRGDNLPVENVSWDDAVEFCKRLSKATDKEYRLPSEAEWEYACRAGTTTPFHFGETITTDLANYNGTYTYANAPKGIYRGRTTPVGSFPPNNFGLYDMHGNVWEWCADFFYPSYLNAPDDGRSWISTYTLVELNNGLWLDEDINIHVRRGGSWDNKPNVCRSACRNGQEDNRQKYYNNNWNMSAGLRIICEV